MLAILLFTAVSAKFDGLAEDGYTGEKNNKNKPNEYFTVVARAGGRAGGRAVMIDMLEGEEC